jgi:hypothetical protein
VLIRRLDLEGMKNRRNLPEGLAVAAWKGRRTGVLTRRFGVKIVC